VPPDRLARRGIEAVDVVHAICSGSGIVRVRTVDSDVIVILLGASAKLKQGSPSICGDGFGCIKKSIS
jgi:hypothetical protein